MGKLLQFQKGGGGYFSAKCFEEHRSRGWEIAIKVGHNSLCFNGKSVFKTF